MEKLEGMKEEEYERKEYLEKMKLSEARTMFRIRTRMIKCAMNQSSERATRDSLWQCNKCG